MDELKEIKLEDDDSPIEISKPLRFIIPDTLATNFSDYTLVQGDPENFTLSFFEIRKPAIIGSGEEKKAAIEKIDSIPAVCIARIVITPNHFKRLIEAMQSNLLRSEKSKKISKEKTN